MLANKCNGEANIETLPQYIFVFGNEILIKIILIFQTPYIINLRSIRYAPRYPPEIFLRLWPRNTSLTRLVRSKNGNWGRQKTSAIHTNIMARQMHEH